MKFTTIQWQSDLYQQEIALRDAVLRKPLGLGFTAEDLEVERDQMRFGVIENDELIASALIVVLSPTSVKLRQMAVAPSQQGKGVGTFLLGQVESALAAQGYQRIELHARHVALPFYEKLGYQAVGDEFIEVNIPHFKMTKTL